MNAALAISPTDLAESEPLTRSEHGALCAREHALELTRAAIDTLKRGNDATPLQQLTAFRQMSAAYRLADFHGFEPAIDELCKQNGVTVL